MSLMKNIVAMGITVGLSDREAFVNKVSEYIQQYKDDPEKAEKWANAIVNYLEEMKDNIRVQNAVNRSFKREGLAGKDNMEELTLAIKALTAEVQKLKEAK